MMAEYLSNVTSQKRRKKKAQDEEGAQEETALDFSVKSIHLSLNCKQV